MKKVFMTIFCVLIAVFAIFAIRYVSITMSTNTVNMEIATEEKIAEAKGFIMRDERVYTAQGSGTVYTNVSEGARVSRDAYIGTVYHGEVSSNTLKEFSNLDKKIAQAIENESRKSYYVRDDSSIEGEIASLESQIIEAAENNDILKIAEYKAQINGIRTGEQTYADEVEQLTQERKAAEERLGASKTDMFADMSGTFTTYIDGLEGALNPSMLDAYTAEMIESLEMPSKRESTLGQRVSGGDAVFKVVNNHVWYAMLVADRSVTSSCKEGDTVTLRFKNMANAVTSGKIESITEPDEEDRVLLTIKSSVYFEGAFAYREADVDLVFESYTGYKVPVFAVRTVDGNHSVIGEIGKKRYTCDCDVLYSDVDQGFVIIQSTEGAVNKLSQMERIVTGE